MMPPMMGLSEIYALETPFSISVVREDTSFWYLTYIIKIKLIPRLIN
jgi:hypothetical protein